jgi:hypothetical protein
VIQESTAGLFPAGRLKIGVWKMKKTKRAVSLILAALLVVSAAGCSGDKSWAAKDSSTTVTIGSYIYYLYTAYSSAQSKVSDSSKKVLEQKIDGKDASAWIREKAMISTKEQILVSREMNSKKLSLSDDEKKQAESVTDSTWNQYSKTLEKYGIAKTSFQAVVNSEYGKDKIFEAVYGKNGSKAVSDEDLKNYFVKNDTSFSLLAYPLYTMDSSGAAKEFSADQKKKAKQLFDGYADQIKAGKQTVRQAADAYKKSSNATTDPLMSKMANLSTDTQYPDEIKKALKSMKTGEVKTLEVTAQKAYFLLYKDDISKTVEEKIQNEDSRKTLLITYKWSDFTDSLDKQASSLSGVNLNESAMNSYDPSMFQS